MSTYLWWRDNLPRPRPHSASRYSRSDVTSSYLSNISDEDCIELYRLDKEGVSYIAEKIITYPNLSRSTSGGLPIKSQLLVALRYYATGNSTVSLKNTASLHLSHGSVHNCIRNVSSAIASLANEFIQFPTDDTRITKIKQGFFEY